MKLLIAKKADVDSHPKRCNNIRESTPLHQAVLEEQYVAAQLLLASGASVHLKHNGFTPLLNVKSKEMAKLLLNYGADIDTICGEDTHAVDAKGYSVLHSAVWRKSVLPDLIAFLIENGAPLQK